MAFESNEFNPLSIWVQKKREYFFKTRRLAFFYLQIIISINKKTIKNNLAEDETVTDRIVNPKPIDFIQIVMAVFEKPILYIYIHIYAIRDFSGISAWV